MMEGLDPKRPRLFGPPDWRAPAVQSQSPRALPLPNQKPPSYNHHTHPPSFQHPEGPSQNTHDRRPHQEYSHYEQAHQELHRPVSGPPHNYHHPPHHSPQPYSAHQPPMLKKDSSEGSQPPQQIFRPPSNSNGFDHNVNAGTHHEASGRPLPYDSARPDSFQQSPYQSTNSPMAAPDQYHGRTDSYGSFPSNGLPNTRDPLPSVSYPPVQRTDNQSQVKRKAQRAAQACDSCRTLKAKCDEGRPACGNCKEKGAECKYRDPAPKPTDKATADVLERMDGMMAFLNERFNRMEQELETLKNSLQNNVVRRQSMEPHFKQEANEPSLQVILPVKYPSTELEKQNIKSADSPHSFHPGQQRDPVNERQRVMLGDMATTLHTSACLSDGEEDARFAKPGLGASTMPSDHKTSATELLLIPAIAKLTTSTNKDTKWFKKIGGTGYPFEVENRRGTLRLYGRGEGNDPMPGYDKDPMIDQVQESFSGDSPSSVPSPDGFRDERGQIVGFTPPPHPDYPSQVFQKGDINPLGMPDLSEMTVQRLIRSYEENINNMHPLLAPKTLGALVRSFLKNIPDGPSHQPKSKTAAFIGGSFHAESPVNKRKRSPDLGEYPESSSTLPEYKTGHPMRNMTTCIILLCMALGKICLSEGNISDYYDNEKDTEGRSPSSPVYRNGNPPSPLSRPSSTATPMGSPHDMERQRSRSRRTSVENPAIPRTVPSKLRNIDRIPGLSYFAIATDIIGNHIGATGLMHVHANILAALYEAQMARVIESAAFLFSAGRGLRKLLEKKRGRFQNIKENKLFVNHADNPLIFAFWTCLQLESDIIAEMPLLPQSGIMKLEENMPDPNYSEAEIRDGFDLKVIRSYMAQLYLRKNLNTLHQTLYTPKPGNTPTMFRDFIEGSIQALTDVSTWASTMSWPVEKGEPATEILGARLRAKFYGAQVITYRFFVLKLLEGKGSTPTLPEIAMDEDTRMSYASNGLRALIHSTRAFYGLGIPGEKRLNVTNVWGTAHAQWGNMLVLQAAFMSPVLRPLLFRHITPEQLGILHMHTMNFLRSIAARKSALWVDLKILQDVGIQSGLARPQDISSSFGSSVDTPMDENQH